MHSSPLRRVLLFPPVRLVMATVTFLLLNGIAVALMTSIGIPPSTLTLMVAQTLSVLATFYLVVRRIEGSNLEQAGLPRRSALRQFTYGAALGAGIMVLVAAVFAVAGWYRPVSVEPSASLASATAFFLLVALSEEILFRGLAFRIIEDGIGSWGALAVSSAFFGVLHIFNPNATVAGAVGIAVAAGGLLGGAYLATRSLWLPIGIHWTWNLVQGPVFGMRVSGAGDESFGFQNLIDAAISGPEVFTGGAFGPEAGLVAIGLGTLAAIPLILHAHRRGLIRRAVSGRRTPETTEP